MSITAVPGGVRIDLHVQPGAATTAVVGLHGNRIRLRVHAPPVEGRANLAVIRWIAAQLGVPRSAVTLVRGGTSRQKTVEVRGVSVAEVEAGLRGKD